jgi:hypothetical protein
VPARLRLSYRARGAWRPVAARDEHAVARNAFNRVAFDPVTTTALRVDLELRPGCSGGVLRWRVEGTR